MKKVVAAILFIILSYSLLAQDTITGDPEGKTPKFRLSGFGGIMSETSLFRKGIAESLGAGGALMINNYFFLGGYALGMASNHYIDDLVMPTYDSLLYMDTKLRINYSHAGIWVGGIFFPNKKVHLSVSSRVGWGHIYLTEKYNTSYINNENYKLDYTDDKIFVISPQVELELQITSWLKTNIGIGYNFVTGVSFDRYQECKFSSPQITIGIYFGGFSSKDDNETPENDNTDE